MNSNLLEHESTNGNGVSDRIRWTNEEIKTLADGLVEARIEQPVPSLISLFEGVQRKVLPGGRQRDLPSLSAHAGLNQKFGECWKAKLAAANAHHEPHIIHVETQQAPDYVALSQRLDLPSLVAMCVAKLGLALNDFKPVAGALGTADTAHSAPLRAEISLLAQASARPRPTRVLLIGPTASQFNEIKQRSAEAKIPIDLQYLDKDKPKASVPILTDYVVATRFITHSFEERIKTIIPAGRYFYLHETGTDTVVQKLRDLGSLLPARA